MGFVHGSSTRVLVNAKEISSEVSGWTVGYNRQMSDVTCVGQTPGAAGSNFVPGLMSGTLGLRGPQSADPTLGLTAEIQAAIGVDNAFQAVCLPDGVAIGKPAFFVVGDPTDYTVDATVSDALAMTMAATADESVEMGYVLAALQAYTADALTGTAVDRGTGLSVVSGSPVDYSTNGFVGSMNVTAYTGFTSVAVKIQHSADNSSWADLVAFTTVTAAGGANSRQRVSVAKDTQINRYLRTSIDVTGTGSVTLLVAGAPR